jgi:hypothetical protein
MANEPVAHWDKVPVRAGNGQKISESEFYEQTPGGISGLLFTFG